MGKKRILIIDDEPDFTSIMKTGLMKTGLYEVKAENDGLRGLETARAFKPDLILLDYSMPYIQGNELAEDMKGDEELKDTPIVFISGVITKGELGARVGKLIGHTFIAKPLTVNQVVTCVNEELAKRSKG